MNLCKVLNEYNTQGISASRNYGVVVGIVTSNKDEEGLGRVKVKFPWLSAQDESKWARIATPMTGDKKGIYFLPEVNDEVLVIFGQGDLRCPYVIGALWNGQDKPPTDNKDGKNNLRMIKSRSGHQILLNDEEGKETIEIRDKTAKNRIVFDTASNSITISADADITLSASQGTIKLDAQKIEINSTEDTTVDSGSEMNIQATKNMNLQGQTINLN